MYVYEESFKNVLKNSVTFNANSLWVRILSWIFTYVYYVYSFYSTLK